MEIIQKYSLTTSTTSIIIEIKSQKDFWKGPNIWKLNNILLNNPKFEEKFTRKIRKCFELNENKNKAYQNLCNVAEEVLRGKFIPPNV